MIFSLMQQSQFSKRIHAVAFNNRQFSSILKCGTKACCYPVTGSAAFLSTPIYYVNGAPHIGHAYTSTMSDIIARSYQMNGVEVMFLTGTDEHGLKVEQSANKAQMTPQDFATQNSTKFKDLNDLLGCSNSDFLRTTEERHKAAVAKLWQTLVDRGEIYLGAYEGWYSVRDEAFYSERDLIDGKAPTGADVEWVKEESYFFRLSNYTEKLLDYYEKNPSFINPAPAYKEIKSFVSKGLRDLSVSRSSFSWGIPVPGDPKHVIYVWMDALTNYLTAVGYPDTDCSAFKKYWPATMHIVGKDIMTFHAVFWPAFLMAAELPPPKSVYGHGWWTKDGVKMSKSVGNVVDPIELIHFYGKDYVRYFFAAEVPFGDDGNFSHDRLTERVNANLSNNYGNLINRVMVMINRHCDATVPKPEHITFEDEQELRNATETVHAALNDLKGFHFKDMCDRIMFLSDRANAYLTNNAVWELAKTEQGKKRLKSVLYVASEIIRHVAVLLLPITPKSSNDILDAFGVPTTPETRGYGSLVADFAPMWGNKVAKAKVFFPKIVSLEGAPADVSTISNSEARKHVGTKIESGESFPHHDCLTLTQIMNKIQELGDCIRNKKVQNTNKDELKPLISELQYLKNKKSQKETA